jgi:flagellar biosynthesis protein FlhB
MSEKRFPASRKQQQEARARGDIPRAALLTKASALLGGVLGLAWQAPVLQRIFLETPWLAWPLFWWSNLTQLAWVLASICGGAALGAYVLGSLAGGFLFSVGALHGSPGLSRLSPSANFFLSLLGGLLFLGALGYVGALWFSGLSWASAASDERLFAGLVEALLKGGLSLLGLAVSLGALQAIFSWYLWSQQHQRTSQQFIQDSKEEEGAAKQFFSSRIATQMKRPG